ncbi:hypothetical protein [Paenibacillus pinihumi]|uniref:hypothetical protein n=1 Tax=Paenibacillus pinihumi TaxID=669462 RepID=UPI00040859C7|nr:hypothetical protein [Paenibacillus pinihumi]
MTYTEMLGRRSTILKRNIGSMIRKQNKCGLSGQESNFYYSLLRELHQTEQELNAVRKDS